MLKKLSAIKARQNLGQIMNEVSLKGDDYIIERAGKPLVAIISMEKFQILQKEREEILRALDKIWGKMRGEKPETLEKTIGEAVKSARRI
jgi:prevent-host-death family protein